MSILDDIVGRRVLVGNPGDPNRLVAIRTALPSGILAKDGENTYHYPWKCVRNFLVDVGFIGSGDRVVNLHNLNLLGTVREVGRFLWIDVDYDGPHMCSLPPPGFWCTREIGHPGSCPTYTRGLYQGDRRDWARFIYRPDGLDEFLYPSSLANPAPKVLTRFDIMEDM